MRADATRQALSEGASYAVLSFIETAPLRYLAHRTPADVLRDGRLVQVKNEEGLYGVVDWHGNLVLPFGNYSGYDTYTSSDGSLLLVGNRDTRMVEAYAVR